MASGASGYFWAKGSERENVGTKDWKRGGGVCVCGEIRTEELLHRGMNARSRSSSFAPIRYVLIFLFSQTTSRSNNMPAPLTDSSHPPIPPRIPLEAINSLIPRLTTTINDIDSFKSLLAAGDADGSMPDW